MPPTPQNLDAIQDRDSPPPGSKVKDMAAKLNAALSDDSPGDDPEDSQVRKLDIAKSAQEPDSRADKQEPAKPAPKKKEAKSEPELPKLKTIIGPKPDDEPADPDGDSDSLDDDDSVPDTIRSTKAADDFRKIKKSLKESRVELEKARSALKEREDAIAKLRDTAPAGPSKEDYDGLLKQRDELQKQLETVALERSDKFQSKYKETFDGSISRAKRAVGEEHASKIEGLMALPPSKWRNQQIEAIRESIETGVDKAQLDLAVASMDAARENRDRDLANAHEQLKALQEEEARSKAVSSEESKQKQTRMITEAERLAGASTAFEKIDGQDDHNSLVDQRLARVRKFLSGEVDERTMINYAVMAEEDQFLTTQYIPALLTHIKNLDDELKSIKGAGPSIGTRGPVGEATKGRKRKSFIETYQDNAPQ